MLKRTHKDTNVEYVAGVDYLAEFSDMDPKKCKDFSYLTEDDGAVISLSFNGNYDCLCSS